MEYLEFYSWDIKQSELHAPPFEQTGQHLAFIATEREVFGQDVSVAPFEFPYQSAFRAVSTTEQRARAHIVRKYGQEQSILAEAAEKSVAAKARRSESACRSVILAVNRSPFSRR